MSDEKQAKLPKDTLTYLKTVLKTEDPMDSAISLAAYAVPGSDGKKNPRHTTLHGKTAAKRALRFLTDFDTKGDGIYACVGRVATDTKKPSKNAVTRLTTLHADFDRMDKEIVLERLRSLSIVPTLIADSGNGIHAYWCLETSLQHTDETQALVEGLNKEICRKLGADISCFNVDRRMRLPGSTHSKDKNDLKPCHIVELNEDERYSVEELQEFWTDLPVDPIPLKEGEKELTTYKGKHLSENQALGLGMDELEDIVTEIGAPLHPAVIAIQAKMISQGYPEEEVREKVEALLDRCPRQARVAEGRENGEWEESLRTAVDKYENPIRKMQFAATRGELSEEVVKEEEKAKEERADGQGHMSTGGQQTAAAAMDDDMMKPAQARRLVQKYAKKRGYWPDGTTKEGDHPVCGDWNIAVALHRMGYRFRWNKRFQYLEYLNPKEGETSPARFDDRILTILPARLRMGLHMTPRPTKDQIDQVINMMAKGREYCPVEEYLDCLPEWDGTERVRDFFMTYCNADLTYAQDAVYLRGVARCVFVGSVARALDPGCKMDTMLILVGEQGCRKSTTVQALYSINKNYETLYASHHLDWDNADKIVEQLTGPWGVEHDELAGLKFKEVEAQKAGLSRQVDMARPKYGRYTKAFPRACAVWGTTNKDDFLADDTGSRRMHPVKIARGETIDTGRIIEDRDQLWAEALWMYTQGEKHTLAPDEVRQSLEVHTTHSYDDPIIKVIAAALEKAQPLTHGGTATETEVNDDGKRYLVMPRHNFLKDVLSKSDEDISRITRPEMRRLNTAMTHLGWEHGSFWDPRTGKTARGYRMEIEGEL